MAALGSIGFQPTTIHRLIPLPVTTPTGLASSRSMVNRCIFDVVDATNVTKGFMRAFVNDHWRITEGRHAVYLASFTQIRGTVKNSAGAGIARGVIVINNKGACVARGVSASDGTFSLLLDNQGTNIVGVIAVPDPTDARNAQVKWGITPVASL